MTCDVVIVGAGLSGLTAAHRLAAAGVDVLVLEARKRPGGRLFTQPVEHGGRVEMGGELVMAAAPRLVALADELGVGLLPEREPAHAGAWVRIEDCKRIVEPYPLAADPAAEAAFAAASDLLWKLSARVDVAAPWAAAGAAELDHRTLGDWLGEHVADAVARNALAGRFGYLGFDPHELSLLCALWYLRSAASAEEFFEDPFRLLDGGTTALVEHLMERVGDRVRLAEPVRAITRDEAGVAVRTDDATYEARMVIAALAPALCARIEWEPRLPPARDRLQNRWLGGRGVKFNAYYDTPWWREEGLSGDGAGDQPIGALMDVSPPDGSYGRLLGFHTATGSNLAEFSDAVGTPERRRATFLDALECYLGPRAREAREISISSWFGDPWSDGCGSGTPPGVLSTVGPVLRAPVGRVLWAGEEAGFVPHMDGAVSSGERAADEALELLGAGRTS